MARALSRPTPSKSLAERHRKGLGASIRTDETKVKTAQALRALAALSQETRLGIYRLLVQQGPEGLAVGAISERMDVGGATLSFHLKELAHANLLTARQNGRYIYYAANYPAMNDLMIYLTENCCQGQACALDCKATKQPQRKRA